MAFALSKGTLALLVVVCRPLFGAICLSVIPPISVRMLLKNGYRHVYISRAFARQHGFIPQDAAPGHYGYSGLITIGKFSCSLNAIGS
jgi:hypothetical protein